MPKIWVTIYRVPLLLNHRQTYQNDLMASVAIQLMYTLITNIINLTGLYLDHSTTQQKIEVDNLKHCICSKVTNQCPSIRIRHDWHQALHLTDIFF